MKWNILHESRGRMRLHLNKKRMSLAEADQLQDYLTALPSVRTAAVYERTCDVVVVYTADRAGVVKGLAAFTFDVEALAEVPANSLAMVGDSLPAFGIVAAVMGVVHALASADRPAAELGSLIAHAMVGTFLGILLAYGFISPLASVLRQKSAETTKMMQCVKITLLSNLNGYAPPIAVEFGRKTLYSSERPSFIELEEHVRAVRNPTAQQTTEEA
mgnify:CR=1 FL=1